MLPLRVLVIDDEELIRLGITRLVEQTGDMFKVVGTYASAKEALALLETEQCDLLITDIRMPEMDGLELLAEVRRLHPDIFSMVISGFEEFTYAQRALKLGASDYILKPIDRKQFRDQLINMKETIINYQKKQYLMKDLENEYKKSSNLQFENFLNSILYASRLPNPKEWERFLINPSCRYRIFAASIDRRNEESYSERDYELFEFAMNGIMNDVCKEWEPVVTDYSVHPCRGLDGWGWVLIMEKPHDANAQIELDSMCEQFIEKLQDAFKRYLPLSVSIGISSELEDAATITQAAAEARASLQRRIFEGGGQSFWMDKPSVIHDEAVNEARSAVLRIKDLENKLLNVIRAFDDHAIRAAVDELFAAWRQNSITLQKVPVYMLSLMLRANILIDEIRIEEREAEKSMSAGYMESTWKKLQGSTDLLKLKDEFMQFLVRLASDLKNLRSRSDKEPIEKAKTYIEQHLAEELTLNHVAGKVYLNPSYFSSLFKIQTGENFLNYVTRIRMEKAQQLLEERDLKLHEIAMKVGYQNPKYFTKLFKDFSGMTPTDYRELQTHE